MAKNLSVIVPAYNEERAIKSSIESLIVNLSAAVTNFEVVIVNDGSADRTAAIIAEMAGLEPRIKVIQRWRNHGFGAAIMLGFANAQFEYLLINPVDNVVSADELQQLFKAIENSDIVAGVRQKRSDYSYFREFCSTVLKYLVRLFFGLKMKDIGWVALYRKDKLRSLRVRTEYEFTLAEILVRAKKSGYRIKELAVHYSPRTSGRHTGANLRAITSILRDLVRVRLEMWLNKQ
ncbi:MAG: glycosyltransferase family 2 protein [Candidatus Omnitrophota bacterium]